MKVFFNQLKEFLNETSKDPRIPLRDKKLVVGILVVLVIRIRYSFFDGNRAGLFFWGD
jgi:hypothetical protein